MNRQGAAGPSAYGLGGLVPPCRAPSGRFLRDDGSWATPAGGGGGTTNHADLVNRGWSVSGHTGLALALAAFSAAGGATFAVLGTDVAAYDAGIASLATADSDAGFAYPNGANAWTRLALTTDAGIYATSTSALATYALTSVGRAIVGAATTLAAREALEVAIGSLGPSVYEVHAPAPGFAYPVRGFGSAAGIPRGSTAIVVRGRRMHATHQAASTLDAQTIGGFNTESANFMFSATSAQKWTALFYLGTNANANARGGFAMSSANITDVDRLAANCLGIRHRPTTPGTRPLPRRA
jgi:hypothetical protein